MDDKVERRVFMKGAAAGAVTVSVAGIDWLLDARNAHAQGSPFRILTMAEVTTFEALGETLLPGARAAGIAHFVDRQLSLPPEEALLEARILNVKPPYVNFYRASIGALDRAARTAHGKGFGELDAAQRHDLVDLMRQARIVGWQGPPAPLVYAVVRSDAVDVVYGTMEGYATLGIPYMAHIPPKQRW